MELGCALLFVRDFTAMREFYRQLLQTAPVNSEWTDSWALFDLGGAQFALHAIPDKSRQGVQLPEPFKPREQSPVKLIFRVRDVAIERTRLASIGVPLLQREWQNPEECCDAVDPEGNVFQITAIEAWRTATGA